MRGECRRDPRPYDAHPRVPPASGRNTGRSVRKRGKAGAGAAGDAGQLGAPSAADDLADTLRLSEEQSAEGSDGAESSATSGSDGVFDSGSGEEDSEDEDAELLEDSDVEGTSDAEEGGAGSGEGAAEGQGGVGSEGSDPYMRGLKRGKDGQLYIVNEEAYEEARQEQAKKTLPVDPVRTMLLNAEDVSSDEEVGCSHVAPLRRPRAPTRLGSCARRRAATRSETSRCGGTATRSTWGTTCLGRR